MHNVFSLASTHNVMSVTLSHIIVVEYDILAMSSKDNFFISDINKAVKSGRLLSILRNGSNFYHRVTLISEAKSERILDVLNSFSLSTLPSSHPTAVAIPLGENVPSKFDAYPSLFTLIAVFAACGIVYNIWLRRWKGHQKENSSVLELSPVTL